MQHRKRQHYQHLWKRYSQGVQANNLAQLDEWVARRTFASGESQRDIALMLVAGSPYVRRIDQKQGKSKAVDYVNQKRICYRRWFEQQAQQFMVH
ncbi:MAG: hypothetical protein QNJ46_32235 [Leptolyngbyaceae cyanobacterium MO_188.B28]|nr:hypothetical protein [Leptolyngbyaceae cyanobacterium MO_188.B28]